MMVDGTRNWREPAIDSEGNGLHGREGSGQGYDEEAAQGDSVRRSKEALGLDFIESKNRQFVKWNREPEVLTSKVVLLAASGERWTIDSLSFVASLHPGCSPCRSWQ